MRYIELTGRRALILIAVLAFIVVVIGVSVRVMDWLLAV